MADSYELVDGPSDRTAPGQSPRPSLVAGATDDLSADFCPRCGKAMSPAAIICVSCGFDMRTGKDATSDKISGLQSSRPDDQHDARPPLFVPQGDGPQTINPKVLMLTAGLFALVAAVLAATFLPALPNAASYSWWARPARVLLVIMALLVHTAAGVLAVYLAALWLDFRVGAMEQATGRIAVAVAVFLAVIHIPLGFATAASGANASAGSWWAGPLAFVLACAAYLGSMLIMLRRRPELVLRIGLAHLAVSAILQMGLYIYSAVVSAAAQPPV